MHKIIQVAAAAAVLLPVSTASAEQRAAKIVITPTSPMGAIVFKSPDLPRPNANYLSSYKLGFKAYDPEAQSLRGGPFGGGASLSVRPSLFAQGYIVSDLKPGTYVVTDFSRQDKWALCFHDNSVAFTLKPGEVLYLGDFAAAAHLFELERMAISSGKTSLSQYGLAHFFDNVSPPSFAPGGPAELAAVAAMMKTHMPRTTVAPKPVQFTPARFGTGRDLFGTQRICGGYYTGKAKPK